MYKRIAMVVGLSLLLFGVLFPVNKPTDGVQAGREYATDLYHVAIGSQAEADALLQTSAVPILRVAAGYLVLAEPESAELLAQSGLGYYLVESDVSRSQVALDIRHDRSNVDLYPLLYEEGDLRLFKIDPYQIRDAERSTGLAELPRKLVITYNEPIVQAERFIAPEFRMELDSLVDLISRDSLESYSYDLQADRGRPAGSNYGPALDLKYKFTEFGYDSVYLDEFWRLNQLGNHLYHGWNVVVTKVGTVYPEDHIIIGAHFDTEAVSPGADDNGSGTSAVLEIARVLQDIETNITIVFILFDCEEEGLLGAYEYAEKAFENKERIVFMLNLDMIAELRNDVDATLYTGQNTTYAGIWTALADSLSSVGITGHWGGSSSFSDHAAFVQMGYDVVFVIERFWSSVYHTSRDSTTYLNFDYMTRMVKASLATAYYVAETYVPSPYLILRFPEGTPDLIAPGGEETVRVHIDEYAGGAVIANSVKLNCSMNGEPAFLVPMTDLGGGDFEAALPPMVCGDLLRYHVMAAEAVQECVYHYPDPENPVFSIMTSYKQVILDDDFNADQGWTVSGDASCGTWERYLAASNADYPKSDFDLSGRCYITDHSMYEDVDRGSTILLSPPLDVSTGKTFIEFASWYDNGIGITGKSDVFRVSVFDGREWIVVDTSGPVEYASGGWKYVSFWLNDFCTPTGQFQLRFDASDTDFDSRVEAAVDAVRFTYFSNAPEILTHSLPDILLGNSVNQQFEAAGCYDPLIWSDKNNDLEGSGLIISPEGLLVGTPADSGVISFTAVVVDDAGVSNERTYQFHVWLPFICGDAGMDYQLNVGDAVYLINYIFKGGVEPYPLCVANANGDDEVDVGDAVYLINHIFKGGPLPMAGCCP